MMSSKESIINLTPELIRLIQKLLKFSKGGFTIPERRELARDLLVLVDKVLDGIDI